MQAGVKKRKQAKHAAKANQLRNVKELAQRRDGQGDEEEAECPIAGRVLNEFERIGDGVAAPKRPDDRRQRTQPENKKDRFRVFAGEESVHAASPD